MIKNRYDRASSQLKTRESRKKERLNTELLKSIIEDNVDKVKSLLQEEANPRAKCRLSYASALHLAAIIGSLEIVEKLYEAGAHLDVRDIKGCQPIHFATAIGSLSIVQFMIQKSPHLLNSIVKYESLEERMDELDSWEHNHAEITTLFPVIRRKSSPLHVAASFSQAHIIEYLLKANAEINLTDCGGLTPVEVVGTARYILHNEDNYQMLKNLSAAGSLNIFGRQRSASETKDKEVESDTHNVVKLLIISGSEAGRALHRAVEQDDLKLIDYLLEKSTDIMTLNGDGDTPMHAAVKHRNYEALKYMLSWLSLTDLNKTDKKGMTCLYLAVQTDWTEGVSLLLEAGADVKVTSYNNESVINLAVSKNKPDILQELLSAEQKSSELKKQLDLSLLTALKSRNLKCLELLVEYGADINISLDLEKNTALHIAVLLRWREGFSILIQDHADVGKKTSHKDTVLHLIAKQGDSNLLKLVIQHQDINQIVNLENEDNFTPLFLAIQSGNLECVKLLFNKANINIMLPRRINILHYAVENYSKTEDVISWICNKDNIELETLRNLIESRSLVGSCRLTPLELAAKKGYTSCVSNFLLAEPNIINYEKNTTTAVHQAARYGHKEVLSQLIDYNSKCLEVADERGWYPLHIAARSGHGNCVLLLLKSGANISTTVKIAESTKTGFELIEDFVPKAKDRFIKLFDSYIKPIEDISDSHCALEIDYSLLVGTSNRENYQKFIKKNSESIPLLEYGKPMSFLKTLLRYGNENLKDTLLLHPLIESFLHYKWERLKNFFLIILCCYILYMLALLSYVLLNYMFRNTWFNYPLSVLLIGLLLPLLTMELIHAKALPSNYFTSLESWLKIIMLVTGTLVIPAIDYELFNTVTRFIACISVLFSWSVIPFLLARYPFWGLHILMFEKVAYNVFEVLSKFVYMLIGFMLAFLLYFDGKEPFKNFFDAICKVLIMLLELEYSEAFKEEENQLETIFGKLMFVSFGLVVAMVMVNLIVGMSVSDITKLEKQGRSQRLARRTSFIISLELIFYNHFFLKHLPKCLKKKMTEYCRIVKKLEVHPDDPKCPLPEECKDALLELLRPGDLSSIDQLNDKVDQLSTQVQDLKLLLSKLLEKDMGNVINAKNYSEEYISQSGTLQR